MPRPANPKIYHIVHVDRLPSIGADGYLWADSVMANRAGTGTVIGMTAIKQRRLQNELECHPGLRVGQCVPFYFCPRSVMLYLLHQANHAELSYRGGQGPILHLEGNLNSAVAWAQANYRRWAFTLSNAGAVYFESRGDLGQLDEINWEAVAARQWSGRAISSSIKEGKQAEFLIENRFPWHLVERIGVHSSAVAQQVANITRKLSHRPAIEIRADWYY